MTPATKALDKARIAYQIHEYDHDPKAASYGLEAAEKIGVPAKQVFKTLVVSDSKALYVGIVPVTGSLDLKQLAKALGVKKLAMADPKQVQSKTGYVLGGVSPIGQKARLKSVIDQSAKGLEQIYISGGRRGLDISITPADLAKAIAAEFAPIAG